MAQVPWLKVLDTLGSLAHLAGQFVGGRSAVAAPPSPTHAEQDTASGGALDLRGSELRGPLEARLAGVVVAALKEAFDRDKVRMDLERETLEAERARAERALQAELRRQAADRALTQLRLVALFGGVLFLVSGVVAAWLPGMRAGVSAVLLTTGWALAVGALGCVFAAWQQVTVWATAADPPSAGSSPAAVLAPWLLLASLVAVAASLLLSA
ncbi:MAG TPA: hypothetical protein VM364_13305 [Vicinamibacterales bacterium]|nr:hypothetical protein [Vicinamibacterales bacterium]